MKQIKIVCYGYVIVRGLCIKLIPVICFKNVLYKKNESIKKEPNQGFGYAENTVY